jgi:transcription antitermination factor NusG
MYWNVVHVRAGQELVAADLLERHLQLRVYLPEVMQRRHGKLQLSPLFPGYLFVNETGATGGLGDVDKTPGCGRLVRSGDPIAHSGEPVAIDDGVVVHLQQQVAALNAIGGLPVHNLHPGDQVTITGGPMRGLAAIFLGPLTPAARVKVLLHFLGREQQVSVKLGDVEPSPPVVQRVRRTRGHGRRIHGV